VKTLGLRVGFVVLVGTFLLTSTSYGGPIVVNNASFETLPAGGLPIGCGTGCAFDESTPIPGWTSTGALSVTGQFQPGPPTTMTFFNSVPDGITVAYTNDGTISQTVSPTVALGVVYTLLVSVGVRKDTPDPGTEALVVNGVSYFATGTLPSPGSGSWATFTATYTGLAADVGQTITIQLASLSSQGDWDNVQLSSSASTAGVPEPASGLLVVLGALAFGGIVRFKRLLSGNISQ
jgi:hapalindole biogenesis HpiC1 cyclase-like protein